jgi:ketosteroid isomerase-like protein
MKLIALFLALFVSNLAFAGHHETHEMSENIAVAKAGYDAFNAGDMDAWRAVQADDTVWTIQVGLPYTGVYVGPAAVESGVFGPISEMWPDFKVEPIKFYESGNTVFVHGRMTADGLATESVHMIKIVDGKYASFQPFDDSAAMMKAAKK